MLKLTFAALLLLARASDETGANVSALSAAANFDQVRLLAATSDPTTAEEKAKKDADAEEAKEKGKWFWVVPGTLLVMFAMAVIWKNEKKVVRIRGVIRKAKKEVKLDVSPNSIDRGNNKELVHVTGRSHTAEDVHVSAINYTRGDVYRIACNA